MCLTLSDWAMSAKARTSLLFYERWEIKKGRTLSLLVLCHEVKLQSGVV